MKNKKTVIAYGQSEITVEANGDMRDLRTALLQRFVVVKTPSCTFGSATILGGKIVTSLSLVQGFNTVTIWIGERRCLKAAPVRQDKSAELAELCILDLNSGEFQSLASSIERGHPLIPSGPREIGDSLLVCDASHGVSSRVQLVSMKYATQVLDYKSYLLQMKRDRPPGLVGSAVWDEEGRLKGISIGEMIPPPEELREQAKTNVRKTRVVQSEEPKLYDGDPLVYALPVERVLDFVESH